MTSLTALACAVAVGACGDDGDSAPSAEDGDRAGRDGQPADAVGDPKAVIQRWFEAARLGKASDKCALESEQYQIEQYQEAGRACLQDAANTQPQPVWAKRVPIEKLVVSGDSATATVQPNAGTPAEATVGLTRTEGWLIASFR